MGDVSAVLLLPIIESGRAAAGGREQQHSPAFGDGLSSLREVAGGREGAGGDTDLGLDQGTVTLMAAVQLKSIIGFAFYDTSTAEVRRLPWRSRGGGGEDDFVC